MTNREYWCEYHDRRRLLLGDDQSQELQMNGRGSYSTGMFLSRVIEFVNKAGIKNTDDVVDIGCGTGLVVSVIRPFCETACGLDISSELVEYGKKYNGLKLEQHDITNPLPESWNSSVDKVLCGCLQYLNNEKDVVKVLKNVYAILHNRGRALFYDMQNAQTKNKYMVHEVAFSNLDDDSFAARQALESKRLWIEPRRLEELCAEAGFMGILCSGVDVENLPYREYFFDAVVVK